MNRRGFHRIAFNLTIGLVLLLVPMQMSLASGSNSAIDQAVVKAGQKQVYRPGNYSPSSPPARSLALSWNTFLGSPGGSGMERGNGIAMDGNGNTYVVGTSGDSWGNPRRAFSGDVDAFVAKLDPDGNLIWNTFLGGIGGYEYYGGVYSDAECGFGGQGDEGCGIAVDASGNVYVIGHSWFSWGLPVSDPSGYGGAFVAKLDSNGSLVWNSFPVGLGIGRSIKVDGNGNIYFTGSRSGGAFAARLDGDGNITWSTYVGRDSQSMSNSITLDDSGNVYVAGIDPSGSGFAFFSKVDSSGNLVWTGYLGGPSGYDYGYGIALDAGGNIYIIGTSSAPWGNPVHDFSGNIDAFIAKVDSHGILVWNTFFGDSGYDYGYGINVDQVGNIYITGMIDNTCIDPYPYNGAAFAAKLDNNGNLVWNTSPGECVLGQGSGITVDSEGKIHLAGYNSSAWGSPVRAYISGDDAFIATLDGDGNVIWNTFLGGEPGVDYGRSIAMDDSGNMLIAGQSEATWGSPIRAHSNSKDFDALVAKLDSSGGLLWNTFLGADGLDEGLGIAVDAAGNIYVTGSSHAPWGSPVRPYSGNQDAFVAKLDPNGNLVWNTFLGSSVVDDGRAIGVDGAGNIYIAGYSEDTWGSPILPYTWHDGFTAKLDNNGNLVWNTFLGGISLDDANAISVDSNGNAFVTGTSDMPWGNPVRPFSGSNGFDAYVVRLDSSGSLVWNTFLGGGYWDFGYGIAVNADTNVYVIGESGETWGLPIHDHHGGATDAFIAQLDSSGNLTWNTFLGGSGTDTGYAIAVDASGNAYITGYSDAPWGEPLRRYSGGGDAFAALLDNSGALIWNTFLGGPGWERAYGIAVDGVGNAFVTGYSSFNWGSPQRPHSDSYDAFVASVNGTPPVYFYNFSPMVYHQW